MLKLLSVVALSAVLNTTSQPTIKTRLEFEKHYEERVSLVGIYTPLLLPESKRPGSKLVSSGRISIKLGDFDVALEQDDKGLRSKNEVKKYAGKTVKVSGIIHRMVNLWGNGEQQSIVMPAVTDIVSIEELR